MNPATRSAADQVRTACTNDWLVETNFAMGVVYLGREARSMASNFSQRK